MALSDTATLVIGAGNFYTHAVGTAAPTTIATAPAAGWTNLGHTSLEDILAFASEGGEATTLGTLQKRTLRTSYTNRVETFTLNLQQFDVDALKLYFGSNMAEMSVGSIWQTIPGNPAPTEKAFLGIFADGAKSFGIYAPKVELFRADDLELTADELSSLPVQVKPVFHSTNTWTMAVTSLA